MTARDALGTAASLGPDLVPSVVPSFELTEVIAAGLRALLGPGACQMNVVVTNGGVGWSLTGGSDAGPRWPTLASLPDLSAREREVLDLVSQGLPNKLVARRLAIAEKTVKSHLTRIFRALGVSDRTQAALMAQRLRMERVAS